MMKPSLPHASTFWQDQFAAEGGKQIHYADIVTKDQRETIYGIQRKYFAQTAPLRKQIRDLEKKEDAEIQALLTDEQLGKLKDALAAAKKRRDLTRDLTPEQRRAAEEAARKAFLEAIRKAQGDNKKPDGSDDESKTSKTGSAPKKKE